MADSSSTDEVAKTTTPAICGKALCRLAAKGWSSLRVAAGANVSFQQKSGVVVIGEELQAVQPTLEIKPSRPSAQTAAMAWLMSGELMGQFSTGSRSCEL